MDDKTVRELEINYEQTGDLDVLDVLRAHYLRTDQMGQYQGRFRNHVLYPDQLAALEFVAEANRIPCNNNFIMIECKDFLIRELKFVGGNLSRLKIPPEKFTYLRHLIFEKYAYLPKYKIPADIPLLSVAILECHLTKLVIPAGISLQELWCWGNKLETLSIPPDIPLEVLDLSYNPLLKSITIPRNKYRILKIPHACEVNYH